MRPFTRLSVLACLAALVFEGETIGMQPPTKQKVIDLLGGNDFAGCSELVEMGEKAFPIYEAILADPKADDADVGRVLLVIGELKADRRRFVKYTVSHLTDTKFGVRLNAVLLLKDIGTVAEASPVVALLSDERVEMVYAAAKTLTAIGGPNEVVAMDVWLQGVNRRDDTDLRKHLQKCRNALKKRLDEARAKNSSK